MQKNFWTYRNRIIGIDTSLLYKCRQCLSTMRRHSATSILRNKHRTSTEWFSARHRILVFPVFYGKLKYWSWNWDNLFYKVLTCYEHFYHNKLWSAKMRLSEIRSRASTERSVPIVARSRAEHERLKQMFSSLSLFHISISGIHIFYHTNL